jgi:hypothetical protein
VRRSVFSVGAFIANALSERDSLWVIRDEITPK